MKKFANYLIVEKENNDYIVSMSPELQDDIGNVWYLKLHEEKSDVSAGEVIIDLEASKTIASIKVPLSGKIIEWNKEAVETPKDLSSASRDKNWLVKMTNVDPKEFENLEDY